jgi:tRNA threonylcarbamoyl adenosine modification protein YeaZ
MITLAIDTSTTRGSVALLRDGVLLLDENFSADRSHSATLFSALERAFALTARLDQIVVGLGPGSFAGVRIAIAAAIGLQLSTGAKLLGIPSAAALNHSAPDYLAIGDARRETFYFTRVEKGVCLEGPLLTTEADLRARLLAAAGCPVFATEALPQFPEAQLALPSAVLLARLVAEGRGIVGSGDLEPIYLREPHITLPKAKPGIPIRP